MWTFLVAVGAWGFRSVFEYGVLDVRSKRRRMSNGFCRLDASLFRADKKLAAAMVLNQSRILSNRIDPNKLLDRCCLNTAVAEHHL